MKYKIFAKNTFWIANSIFMPPQHGIFCMSQPAINQRFRYVHDIF